MRTTHTNLHKKAVALDPHHRELCELFSLLEPLADLITTAQAGTTYAPIVLCKLALVSSHLCPDAPLPVVDPAKRFLDAKGFQPEMRDAASLQAVTQATRSILFNALRTRFFSLYADVASGSRSMMYDMAAFFFPPLRSLKYLERLVKAGSELAATPADITARANILRARVHAEVLQLLVKASEQLAQNLAVQQTNDARRHKDTGLAASRCWVAMDEMRELMDVGDSDVSAADHEMIARVELQRYIDMTVSSADSVLMNDASYSLAFWRRHTSDFPLLSIAARMVLGKPKSAAAISRDFGHGGDLITPKRSRLDAGCVEMCLFLHQHLDEIPDLTRFRA